MDSTVIPTACHCLAAVYNTAFAFKTNWWAILDSTVTPAIIASIEDS